MSFISKVIKDFVKLPTTPTAIHEYWQATGVLQEALADGVPSNIFNNV